MTQTESGADSGSFPKDARAEETETRGRKGPLAFRTISEVAEELNIPQHVLRFWETRFEQVRPLQFGPGGRRHYRPDDVALLRRISNLIYVQGYTLKGAQRVLNGLTDEPTESPPEPEAMLEDAIPQAVEGAPILDIVELVEEAPVYSAPYAPEPQAPTPVVDDSAKREVERLRSGLTNILIELEALRRHFG